MKKKLISGMFSSVSDAELIAATMGTEDESKAITEQAGGKQHSSAKVTDTFNGEYS